MRSLQELVHVSDPAWPRIYDFVARSKRAVEVFPAERANAERAVSTLQRGVDDPLGAVAFNAEGILVDRGWLRVLGAGGVRMREGLVEWNQKPLLARATLVAHDVLGGVFALDHGGLGAGANNAFYFSPDSLTWEDMGFGYAGLIEFLLTGDLDGFYGSYRWPHWNIDVAALSPDQGLHSYPPLWTKEGKDPAQNTRRPVSMTELVSVQFEYARQLDGAA